MNYLENNKICIGFICKKLQNNNEGKKKISQTLIQRDRCTPMFTKTLFTTAKL